MESPLALAGAVITLAFAPGLFWLVRIRRQSRNIPDHGGLLAQTFFLGAVSAIPIVLAKLVAFGPHHTTRVDHLDAAGAFQLAFADAGLFEEVGKFLVVRLSVYRSPYFHGRASGLLFAGAAALGFSSLENIEYIIAYGPAVMLLRGVLCTLGHVSFSGLWGYGLGYARENEANRLAGGFATILGLLAAIALHGGYDYFLFRGDGDQSISYLLFLMGVALYVVLLRRSAAKARGAPPTVSCPGCGRSHQRPTRYCDGCGHALEGLDLREACGGCGARLARHAAFCDSCGARQLRYGT